MSDRYTHTPWRQAREALRTVLDQQFPDVAADFDRVELLGAGISRTAYIAGLTPRRPTAAVPEAAVVLLPKRDADADYPARARREFELLTRLRPLGLPFRAPQPIGIIESRGGPIPVYSQVTGWPVQPLSGKPQPAKFLELQAQVAAAVHAVPLPELASEWGWFGGQRTRRAHAETALTKLAELSRPAAQKAAAWARAHLPAAEPGVLLHGDLLGQNVLVDMPGTDPPGLIDWEYASLGDPAADLAILTRGKRQPFGLPDGLAQLVRAYRAAGGADVAVEQVQIHELAMLARQLGELHRLPNRSEPELEQRGVEFDRAVQRVVG